MQIEYRKAVQIQWGRHKYLKLHHDGRHTFTIPFLPVPGMLITVGDVEIPVKEVYYDHDADIVTIYTDTETTTWKQGEEALAELLELLEEEGWKEDER